MVELSGYVFWHEVIRVLQKERNEICSRKTQRYTEEYFEKFKDNPFDEYGLVCLSLSRAKEELQKVNDSFRDALNTGDQDD